MCTSLCFRLEIHLILHFTGVFHHHIWIARSFYRFLSETEYEAKPLKKKTHLKQLNNSLLTKSDDKGNSLLYEGNLSPAYDQNIHLRENFLTECHGAPIVTRIRRHLGMMLSAKWFPDLYVKMGLSQ